MPARTAQRRRAATKASAKAMSATDSHGVAHRREGGHPVEELPVLGLPDA